MDKIRFGRTELQVTRTAFGALPIQRISFEESAALLRRAYDGGINFFDTARGYSNSEEKMGRALADVRDDIIIATKTLAQNKTDVLAELETSLRNLKTDYVDLLQLHNPSELPDPDDPDSTYAALIEAREKGMVRFIGITAHARDNAIKAAKSGLYDTIQFPLNAMSSDEDLALSAPCKERDLGLIAMKGLCGGMLDNGRLAFAFLRQYENIVPIWGIQRMSELEEFLGLAANPPIMDDALLATVEEYRNELVGEYCRGCDYCMPCPEGIPISMASRISFFMRRSPAAGVITEEYQAKMRNINNCTECGQCRERCPYDLDVPPLLRRMLVEYEDYLVANA